MAEFLWGSNNSNSDEEDDDVGQDELAFDDSLDPIQRINMYIKSNVVLHRLHLIRDLADAARQIGYQKSAEHLIPVIQEVKDDGEPVIRQALVEQIAEIGPLFKQLGGEDGYQRALHELLPIVAALTTDSNPQVRQSATESLVELGKMLDHEHVLPHLLPIVKSLAKDSTEEEHRVEGAQLLNDLAPTMQAQLCLSFAIPHIKALSQDPMFRVRKAVASHMGNICKAIGPEDTLNHLTPIFIALAGDDIWGVRKACAETLVAMSENVPVEKRRDTLTKVFEKLAEDTSRWVRGAAFQSLGPFIATFTDGQVPESLLQYYKNMVTDPSKDSPTSDSDNITYCSFNFPAVLKTLGPSGWPGLSDTYTLLSKDGQYKVRRSLSFSLHEVAKILGTALTEKELIPMMELFLKDLEDVRVGVISHLASFFEVLSDHQREEYLYVLDDIQKDQSWRFRKLLAKQIGDFSSLYNAKLVSESIVPLALLLLRDNVVAVRKPLIKCMGKILNNLKESPEKRKELVQSLQSLAKESHYQWRQLYANLCEKLVNVIEITAIEEEFLEALLSLAADKVPNVRFVVAKALKLMADTPGFSSTKTEEIRSKLDALKQDKDTDVTSNATGELPSRLSTYGKKANGAATPASPGAEPK